MTKIKIIHDDTVMSRLCRSKMDEKLDDDEVSGDELIEKLDETIWDYK